MKYVFLLIVALATRAYSTDSFDCRTWILFYDLMESQGALYSGEYGIEGQQLAERIEHFIHSNLKAQLDQPSSSLKGASRSTLISEALSTEEVAVLGETHFDLLEAALGRRGYSNPRPRALAIFTQILMEKVLPAGIEGSRRKNISLALTIANPRLRDRDAKHVDHEILSVTGLLQLSAAYAADVIRTGSYEDALDVEVAAIQPDEFAANLLVRILSRVYMSKGPNQVAKDLIALCRNTEANFGEVVHRYLETHDPAYLIRTEEELRNYLASDASSSHD